MPRASGKGYRKQTLRRYAYFIAAAGLLALLLMQTSPRLRAALEPARTSAADQLYHITGPGLVDPLSRATGKDKQILELEARVRELAQYKAIALTMAERLEVYEDILNIQGEPEGAEITARIMAETDGPFAEALLVNAGSLQGVRVGYYAENDRGLVGRVVQVGRQSGRILKLTDFNSRLPVMGEVSGLRAIMSGGPRQRGYLTDLPEQGQFLPNERVLTSGEGGLFPRGVVVGTVIGSGDTADQVELAMLGGQLGYVRLKPTIQIAPPEDDDVEAETVTLTNGDRS